LKVKAPFCYFQVSKIGAFNKQGLLVDEVHVMMGRKGAKQGEEEKHYEERPRFQPH
jgi:hypothetical protein